MSCILSSGYATSCRDNLGGVVKLYIGSFDDDVVFTYGTNSVITGTSSGSLSNFYEFEQEIQTASFTYASEVNEETQSVFYTNTIELTLHKLSPENNNIVKLLAQGKWRVVILDNRGTYWLAGIQNPVKVSTIAGGAGKAMSDLSGATITLMNQERYPINSVESGFVSTFVVNN